MIFIPISAVHFLLLHYTLSNMAIPLALNVCYQNLSIGIMGICFFFMLINAGPL